jgi:post-segregation antitoxin (ccd killing protein)
LRFRLLFLNAIAYRSKTDTKSVRKNVSLPAWMASMADKRGINCSQLLQDSLLSELNA